MKFKAKVQANYLIYERQLAKIVENAEKELTDAEQALKKEKAKFDELFKKHDGDESDEVTKILLDAEKIVDEAAEEVKRLERRLENAKQLTERDLKADERDED